jgi:hypothetical protein
MDFAWREGDPPTAFFPNDGESWFWPGGGARTPGGAVVVFANELVRADGGLGFEEAGWRATIIADPTGAPETWTLTPATVPADTAGQTVACATIDGDFLVAVVTTGSSHDGAFARWSLTDAAAGSLATPAWWDGASWGTTPATVLPDGATECSLTPHAGGWIHIASVGFGATTVGLRSAAAITGPYSAVTTIFEPPESQVEDAFVYAAKAHPQLGTGNELVVTYADNSFTFADLFDPAKRDTLYWPHVARITLTP